MSSEVVDDTTTFVQSHEFALFSQLPGELKIPAFTVRFTHREGFVGATNDHQGLVPESVVEIQRPPDTEDIGFLITTESYVLEENWDPHPGTAKVGDIFKRTITQRASQLSGMALAPASAKVPQGIRVYTNDAETRDVIQRGDFTGSRSETITYLLTKPGQRTLPAVTYVWWNPKSETVQSQTLPAAEFQIQPALVDTHIDTVEAANQLPWGWIILVLAMLVATAFLRLRWQSVLALLGEYWSRMNPPDRVAARSLMKACRCNDVDAGQKAWLLWRNTQPAGLVLTAELDSAVNDLQSHRFSNRKQNDWKGDQLYAAFRNQSAAEPLKDRYRDNAILPRLNP